MRKTVFCIVTIFAVTMIESCLKEDEIYSDTRVETIHKDFHVSLDDDATKTSLSPIEGQKKSRVTWTAGDELIYYSGGETRGYTKYHTIQDDCSEAYFNAELAEGDTHIIVSYGAENLQDYYLDSLVMRGVIKGVQDGTFKHAHASIGKFDVKSSTIVLSNITSLIKFKINDDNVDYVLFRSNSHKQLHAEGKVRVDFVNGKPVCSLPKESGFSIKIPIDGRSQNEFYYIGLLSTTFEDGFTISAYDKDGVYLGSAATKSKVDLKANQILNLETLDFKFITNSTKYLSEKGIANCYVVPDLGKTYSFDATCQGNDSTCFINDATAAEIQWCTLNNYKRPKIDDVVSDVFYKDGKVYFAALEEGNATIAVKNASGVVLWSWHIWVCSGYDLSSTFQEYSNGAGYVMDRNLGATSINMGDVQCNGLLYQWGRKDPFGGDYQTYPDYEVVQSSSETGTVAYSVENPLVFITSSDETSGDWLFTGHDALWSTKKTKYDPCPVGWKVPDKTLWSKAFGKTSGISREFDLNHEGMNLGYKKYYSYLGMAESIWYQLAGYHEPETGESWSRGRYGYWWSNESNEGSANILAIFYTGGVYPMRTAKRAYGMSVRCVSTDGKPKPSIITIDKIEIDQSAISVALYKTYTLRVKSISPDNTTEEKSVKWYSSNEKIASVDTLTGRVTGVQVGDCKIFAKHENADGTVACSDSCSCTVTAAEEVDLSENGNANCYIISTPGSYKFKTVKGNGTGTMASVSSAATLWETFGTSEDIRQGSILNNVSYCNDYIHFDIPVQMNNGNALIVALDSSGKVLWSWHIWVCKDYNPEETAQIYKNGAGVLMDRNLGATSATPGEVQAIGLLYQWGRKDPFLAGCSTTSSTPASSTYGWPAPVRSDSVTGTINYAIENPATFIMDDTVYDESEKKESSDSRTCDWFHNTTDADYNTRWSSSKTLYDPCPVGWRIPDGSNVGVWVKAYGQNDAETGEPKLFFKDKSLWAESCYGFQLKNVFSDDSSVWYPATGYIYYKNRTKINLRGGTICGERQYGGNWSCITSGSMAKTFYYTSGGTCLLSNDFQRASGLAVRCQKETE